MKIATILLVAALCIPGVARAHREVHIDGCDVEPPARLADRHVDDQRFAIVTRDDGATLLLTRHVVAVQLSDRALHRVHRELDRERDKNDDDGFLAALIKHAVLGGVREMLDHSIECPLREVRDVRYHDGTLELVTWDGDRLFEGLEINDEPVLSGFSAADARAFVDQFHRLRDR